MIDKQLPIVQFYKIRIRGHLDAQWADWFHGMSITLEQDGTTLLSGPVPDQPALHGLLRKVRDLGMPLVSVVQLQSNRSEKGERMNISTNPAKKIDTRALLSTLWIVVMINMLKADILSLFIPGAVDEFLEFIGTTPPTLVLLFAAITMEISIVMIVLSRVLKYGLNRWLNIIVGTLTIAFVVGGRASYPHYTFIMIVEVIFLLLIIWNAWKWRNVEA